MINRQNSLQNSTSEPPQIKIGRNIPKLVKVHNIRHIVHNVLTPFLNTRHNSHFTLVSVLKADEMFAQEHTNNISFYQSLNGNDVDFNHTLRRGGGR
jgi:hypothetical protein